MFIHFADDVVVMLSIMGSMLVAVIFWVWLCWIPICHYPLTLRSMINSVVFVYICGLIPVYTAGEITKIL